jgi:glutathione S-transferase
MVCNDLKNSYNMIARYRILTVHSTAADIAHVPYVAAADSARIDIEQFSAITSWLHRMLQRPAVVKCMDILKPDTATA